MRRGTESAPYPVRCILWFAILCPLQIVALGHSGNAVIANLALMAMMLLHVRRARGALPLPEEF